MTKFAALTVILAVIGPGRAGDKVLNGSKEGPSTGIENRVGAERYISFMEGDVEVFAARREHEGNLIVGKYIPTWEMIYIPYKGKELSFNDNIEYLTMTGEPDWITYPGYIPWDAPVGGQEGDNALFVGRKWHEGKFVLGKIVEGTHAIFLPYFGNELRFDEDFEILCEKIF